MKDYYSILGVSRSASHEDIRKTYRKLAIQYHPDKNPDPSVAALFQEINEAYDVLGEPIKRKEYDERLDNPLLELLQEEEVVTKHRDPAYKRKQPASNAYHRPTTSELIKQYLPYFRWLKFLGLGITLLLAIDFILPAQQYDDEITEVYSVRSRRGGYRHHVVITASGRKFKMYEREVTTLHDPRVRIVATPILSTEMSIAERGGTRVIELAYIYRGALSLFPLALFTVALLGILLDKHKEFAFNASIVSGILIVILLYLLS